jgi:predicted metal-binding membrane protein
VGFVLLHLLVFCVGFCITLFVCPIVLFLLAIALFVLLLAIVLFVLLLKNLETDQVFIDITYELITLCKWRSVHEI